MQLFGKQKHFKQLCFGDFFMCFCAFPFSYTYILIMKTELKYFNINFMEINDNI